MHTIEALNPTTLESELCHLLVGVLADRLIEDVIGCSTECGISDEVALSIRSTWERKLKELGSIAFASEDVKEKLKLKPVPDYSHSLLDQILPPIEHVQGFIGKPPGYMKQPMLPALMNVSNSAIRVVYKNPVDNTGTLMIENPSVENIAESTVTDREEREERQKSQITFDNDTSTTTSSSDKHNDMLHPDRDTTDVERNIDTDADDFAVDIVELQHYDTFIVGECIEVGGLLMCLCTIMFC